MASPSGSDSVVPLGLRRELRRIWSQLRKAALRARLGERWSDGEAVARRRYPDYGTYLEHQRLKLDALRATSLQGHDERFHAALTERLARCPAELAGRSVLCLAARAGTEVRAFIERGAFAVGVDLNPGRDNRWVVVGDFHGLQYAGVSVDVVYTNSVDHAFELERMLAEVWRVLKPGGTLIVELGLGTDEGGGRGFYEALSWRRPDQIIVRIESAGFRAGARTPFEIPWPGVQVVLTKPTG
ncbi:MAG: class I SAM-dependent methyltransferase [Gemmatimonadetes bacterium]|nr:class I SAM-dependent methyltransferase [Gemmatimonadota bacterium]